MKIAILDADGKKTKELETPVFDGKIREDIVQKVAEAEKVKQPYSNFPLAGKQYSAAGKIRHGRRRWKTAAGKGISRVPRKIFWRRGTQFYWEGATISGTRGGRRAHPPKILSMINTKKINKKEAKLAFLSALALTGSAEHLRKKYSSLKNQKIETKLPIVVENEVIKLKTKEFLSSMGKILGPAAELAIQKRKVRHGKGKMRGRKYMKSAGALFIIGKGEEMKISGVEIKGANEVRVKDIASNGARLTIYTEKAIKELEERIAGKNKEGEKEKKSARKETIKKERKKKENN
ncbi:50S ribosomal protein L4 [Candidatus Pacearchaeota archaeon RBG_13_36_9]|nr:50S ribosomal protein L4P, large subunit ribosomal protein L4e [uncultured archaeon]OGJ21378.1 MAG: 50S ribosomal protein L4 [Candidatus Pacearchaeota archaeon RBG_13_36_9]